MRYRMNYNYQVVQSQGEVNDKPSETVPDQAMTIEEIMQRHMQGRPVPRSQKMFYGGDQLYPPMEKMSHMDQIDLTRAHAEHIETKKQELAEKRKARKKQIAESKKDEATKAAEAAAKQKPKAASTAEDE